MAQTTDDQKRKKFQVETVTPSSASTKKRVKSAPKSNSKNSSKNCPTSSFSLKKTLHKMSFSSKDPNSMELDHLDTRKSAPYCDGRAPLDSDGMPNTCRTRDAESRNWVNSNQANSDVLRLSNSAETMRLNLEEISNS